MSKIIEQENEYPIQITTERGIIYMEQIVSEFNNNNIVIVEEKYREVALALYDFEKENISFAKWVNLNGYIWSEQGNYWYKERPKGFLTPAVMPTQHSDKQLLQIYLTNVNK